MRFCFILHSSVTLSAGEPRVRREVELGVIAIADALATYPSATGESDKPIQELQDEAIPAMRSAFKQL